MDILDLYHKSLRQPLDPDEEAWVAEVSEEYPYFALPYYLKARKTGDQDDIFIAATHSPDRSLLRNYMEGRSIFDMPVQPQKEQPKVRLRKNRSVEKELAYAEHDHNMMFSLLDFEQLSTKDLNTTEPLSIYPSNPRRKIDEFINTKVKELCVKYLHLPSKIKQQINPYKAKTQESISPKIKEQNSPSLPPQKTKRIRLPESKPLSGNPPQDTISSSRQEKKSQKESSSPAPDVSGMLANFLQSRPSPKEMLSRASKNPDENAVDSINKDEDMVTETLAKLHVKQGNFQAALTIYHRLRLLFPEKSAYFDGRIEQIEQKI